MLAFYLILAIAETGINHKAVDGVKKDTQNERGEHKKASK